MDNARSWLWVCWLASVSVVSAVLAADSPPGLGDPGRLLSITIETGRTQDGRLLLVGRDSGQQLVVNGQYDSGQTARPDAQRRLPLVAGGTGRCGRDGLRGGDRGRAGHSARHRRHPVSMPPSKWR